MKASIIPTNLQHQLADNDFIVSKTDLQGRITYANRIFMQIAQFAESDLLGTQHNIVRHPDMPRGVFKYLWQTLKQQQEFFGFVKNICADGSYYWVFANITPDLGSNEQVTGYYSVRRQAPASAIQVIAPLYAEMCAIEQRAGHKDGPNKSITHLEKFLADHNSSYRDMMLQLYKH
ncbi:MAG: PAS domain-containing protein [Cycloclasticus sp.]